MSTLYFPKDYRSPLSLMETQRAIKEIKDFFQKQLSENLNLSRVSSPLFLRKDSGLNDNLSGVENPVSFSVDEGGQEVELEIVQSLAKWKRYALKTYNIPAGKGIYADMNAIRPSEDPDNIHSYYVDQWDWEKVIEKEDRTEGYLRETVNTIYKTFLALDAYLDAKYLKYKRLLPDDITFIDSQDLENLYPRLSPKERERKAAEDHRAIFIEKIGGKLKSGSPHDSRSPDYDDWQLNGDIIFWNPILNDALELSSMGIRVSPESLLRQLEEAGAMDRMELKYHKMLASNQLPYTIGGGIGQSRMCMFFLQKAHIGEVQTSVWPENMRRACRSNGIDIL